MAMYWTPEEREERIKDNIQKLRDLDLSPEGLRERLNGNYLDWAKRLHSGALSGNPHEFENQAIYRLFAESLYPSTMSEEELTEKKIELEQKLESVKEANEGISLFRRSSEEEELSDSQLKDLALVIYKEYELLAYINYIDSLLPQPPVEPYITKESGRAFLEASESKCPPIFEVMKDFEATNVSGNKKTFLKGDKIEARYREVIDTDEFQYFEIKPENGWEENDPYVIDLLANVLQFHEFQDCADQDDTPPYITEEGARALLEVSESKCPPIFEVMKDFEVVSLASQTKKTFFAGELIEARYREIEDPKSQYFEIEPENGWEEGWNDPFIIDLSENVLKFNGLQECFVLDIGDPSNLPNNDTPPPSSDGLSEEELFLQEEERRLAKEIAENNRLLAEEQRRIEQEEREIHRKIEEAQRQQQRQHDAEAQRYRKAALEKAKAQAKKEVDANFDEYMLMFSRPKPKIGEPVGIANKVVEAIPKPVSVAIKRTTFSTSKPLPYRKPVISKPSKDTDNQSFQAYSTKSSPKKSTKGTDSKSSKNSKSNQTLYIILGIVAGLLLLGGVGYGVYQLNQ